MKIIEYEDKYLEDVKDLLTELEEYILSIDEDKLDQLHPDYRDKMALLDLEEVNKLEWVDINDDFFNMNKYAGEGNIGHIIEEIKIDLLK